MAGMFDDLMPQQGAVPAPTPSGGMFDDLLSQKEQTAPMSGTAPVPTTTEMFFQNLPKYPGVLASRFADLARRATSGELTPQSGNVPGDVPGGQPGNIGALLNTALAVSPAGPGGLPMGPVPLKAPTEAALEASHTARYESPAIKDLQLKPEAGPDVANIIRTDLKLKKLDQFNAKPYYDLVNRLEKPRFGDNFTIEDFETLRQDANAIASPANATSVDKRAGPTVKKAIDNYLGNIPDNHVLSGDATAANDALLKARGDFAALRRSEDVTSALGRAENQAGSTYSGKGFENASRQALRPILNEKMGISKRPGFEDYTPDELEAARQAVNGTWLGNLVRSQEKRLAGGHGAGSSVLGVGTAAVGHSMGLGPMESAALGLGSMAAGKGFGALANRMAASRGNYLGDLLRSRSPLADEMRQNLQRVPALWPQLMRLPIFPTGNQQQ